MRLVVAAFLFAAVLNGQTTARLDGTVLDQRSEPIEGARIVLAHALSNLSFTAESDADGRFVLSNLPYRDYELRVEAPGFSLARRALSLRTNLPQHVTITLTVEAQATALEVSAVAERALIDVEATGTRAELSSATLERMPISAMSRGLESALLAMPGFAADANGAIHPRGAHNQMTYVVDGMPISDQLTGAFANAVDTSIAQTIELFTGNIPAEFGSKVSGVAQITTHSGLGTGRRFSGSSQIFAAGFDTLGQVTQARGGTDRFGYFASVNTMKTHRYLDQVSLDNLHNGGDSERVFLRLDYSPSGRDQFRMNWMSGRSAFEIANLRSQQQAGQDQRQHLRDDSVSMGWLHTAGPKTTVDSTISWRTSTAQLLPSAGDTPVTAAQWRQLSTLQAGSRWNRQSGRHVIRVGGDVQHFPVEEQFRFAATSPPGRFFQFQKRAAGSLYSGFAQDTISLGRTTLSLGLRYDQYRFLTKGGQWQPRVGIAFHLQETKSVFRLSYNRTYQTPPNENLLLSSSDEAVRQSLGRGILLIRPERQNVFEAGWQQALGARVSLNISAYHKNSRDLQDNDNFFNTGIIFPTSLLRSRTNGAEAQIKLLPVHGLTAALSLTHYHTVVTPPFTGGLFLGNTALDALTAGPFVIDHDQKLGAHLLTTYAVRKWLWISAAVRHDSGLVSNPSDPVQVASDPDYRDLLPYVNLNARVPRVRPRTITDVAVGYTRLRNERRMWEYTVQVTNIANTVALYNFQSIFVGTRVVQPRTASMKLRFFW